MRGPVLIVANHTSHLDSLIVLAVLPPTLSNRVAITAAADRFYTSTLKSAWFSLRYNAYPIARGGGSRALAYSESLLQSGWSLLIFPEGKRSRTGELLPFHPGPAILALRQHVPVLPLYIAGAAESLRPGTRWAQPAPVTVRVGKPLLLDPTSSVAEATVAIEEAVSRLDRRARSRLRRSGRNFTPGSEGPKMFFKRLFSRKEKTAAEHPRGVATEQTRAEQDATRKDMESELAHDQERRAASDIHPDSEQPPA